MEAAVKAGEQNIEAMENLIIAGQALDFATFQQNLQILENSLLEMSKFCLDELSKCNSKFCEMEHAISSAEGTLSLIKDTRGHELIKQGNPCPEGARISTADVKTHPLPKIEIPKPGTYDLMQSMKVLNGIGRAAGENRPLIRKKNVIDDAGQNVSWPWSRQADFFVLKNASEPTTFSQIYGTSNQ